MVPAGVLLVRGTVSGGPEVGVSVNGVVAAVQGQGFAAQLPVTPDVTALTATATAPAGSSGTHSIPLTVSSGTSPTPTLSARPVGGAAPLTVQFAISGMTPASLALDLDGDGSPDFTGARLEGRQFTYTQPGLYFPTATVVDARGGTSVVTTIVHVESPAGVEARFSALWASFKVRLQAGDIPGALQHLSPAIRPQFGQILQNFGASLPAVAGGLEDIVASGQADSLAEAVLLREQDGQSFLYFIYFRRDTLGRWLIEEM
jgi:hypothetical protein